MELKEKEKEKQEQETGSKKQTYCKRKGRT